LVNYRKLCPEESAHFLRTRPIFQEWNPSDHPLPIEFPVLMRSIFHVSEDKHDVEGEDNYCVGYHHIVTAALTLFS